MKSKILLITMAVLLCCQSCESILDVEIHHAITEEQALNTLEGHNGLLIAAYDALQTTSMYGRGMIVYPEVLADNMISSDQGVRLTGYQDNKEDYHCSIWSDAYILISYTNEIINGIDKVPTSSKSEIATKKKYKGEAYMLRALAFFDLARIYSREPNHSLPNNSISELGVPIMTESFRYNGGALPESIYPSRASIAQTYTQIRSDLDSAFVNLNGNDQGNAPYRVSAATVQALTSRVALYQGDYQACINASDWVIANSSIDVLTATSANPYINVFKKGEESLWALHYDVEESLGESSVQGMFNCFDNGTRDDEGYGTEKGTGFGEAIMGTWFVNYLTANSSDRRFVDYDQYPSQGTYRKAKVGIQKVWWTIKFNGWNGGQPGLDDIPMVRISEVYLNRAEARFQAGNTTGALEDINYIRTRRGLAAQNATGGVLSEAIDTERRLELAFEGHRFFDLKRQGKDITKDSKLGYAPVEYANYKVVAKIPQTEIDVNKNLQQNPAY